jgi:hypothetical protein
MSKLATATINFGTHSVRIKVNHLGTISVFKHMDQYCEYEIFSNEYDAADYIINPFNSMHYSIVWADGEE